MNPQALKEHLSNSSLRKRVQTPTVIQMEAAECSAAALSIILGYYKRFVPLEELRYRCGVSRDGSDAYNMVEAAKYYGLDANGFQVNFEELDKLKLPFILYWQNNHFVVLEGCGSDFVFINDPATGPRKISYADFFKNYSNVAITAYPTEKFKKGGSPPRFWRLIKKRFADVKLSTIVFLISIQLILIILGLSFPAFSRIFVDQIISQRMLSWKWIFISFMAIIIVLQATSSAMRGYVANRLSRKLSITYSVNFLWHVLRLPLLFFSQRFGGEIINRMNLNTSISEFITNRLSLTIINTILIFIYGLVMYQYDHLIAGIGVLTALLSVGLFRFIARARANAYNRLQQELAKGIGTSIDALQNMEFIKATGTEAFCFSRIIGYKIKNLNNMQNIGKKDIWLNSFSSLFTQLAGIMLLSIGAWRVMDGHLSIGMLLALQMLMASFLAPFNQLLNFSMQIQSLKIDMMRLDDVLNNPLDPLLLKSKNQSNIPVQKLEGKLALDNVTFGYSPLDDPLISNCSIKIEPGQRVAIVGATGSGKSTLARIMSGLFKPWEGTVLYDDIPFMDLSKEQFKNSVAWVDQDVMIFSGSIRDNLTLWNKHIDNDQLVKGAKDALIYETIKKRDQDFDSQLLEAGANLSQGEKQRLEIARALVLNPSILILDEALSALDSQTEGEIFHNIERLACTCVIITHRLSTIKNCDKIYVMEAGKIIQQGSHEELKATPGVYQNLAKFDSIQNSHLRDTQS
ncbi:MAG: NHLP family bacteriocin export ABC transporter peptidase/permease/ATPase subunit [Parachlamydiaceae bacterium]|nr:NHLP family bacteriocin export ABC transporter peptidase/permease/ATPase subunit [Parachlamydiaceae bacterium]